MAEQAEEGVAAREADAVGRRREAVARPRETSSDVRRCCDHGERPQGRSVSTRWSTPIPQAGQRGGGTFGGAGMGAGSIESAAGSGLADAAMRCSRAWARSSWRDGLNRP